MENSLSYIIFCLFVATIANQRIIFIRPSSDGTYNGMVMSVRVCVRPTLRPGRRLSVFLTFILHALTYWAESLHVTLF